jgi:Ca2+-transporting ATPase
MIQNAFQKRTAEVLNLFNVDPKEGLTTDEVIRRQQKYGLNELKSKKKKSFVVMFFEEFKSAMIIILLIAAVISGITSVIQGEGLLETLLLLRKISATSQIAANNKLCNASSCKSEPLASLFL